MSRILTVPYAPQPEWYFCGPACLSMTMSFFGVEQNQYAVARIAKTNEEIGTTHAGMVKAARHHGMYVVERHNARLQDLLSFIKRDIPVIVYIFSCDAEQKKYGILDQMHYLTIVGYREGMIIFHDSDYAEGGRPLDSMPIEEFMTLWRSERSEDENWMMAMTPTSTGESDELTPLV